MDEPNEVCLGSKGWVEYVDNNEGLGLCRYFWPAEGKAKAVILCVHGHGGHMQFEFLKLVSPGQPLVYEGSWIQHFNKLGFSVCGHDHQSHGLSQGAKGLRCYFNKFQDFVDDLLDFGRWLKDTSDTQGFSGLPVFLLGKSLGGCIATNAIHQQGDLFKGAVLLAPMLSLEKVSKQGLNPYLRPIASILSWVTPSLPVAEVKANKMFPLIQEAYDRDVACWHKFTRARVAAEYLKATEETCNAMKDMNFPFLVVHSSKDDMTDPDGSKQLHEQSQAEDKTLQMMDDMWHFLIKEPGNERIRDMTVEWLSARV
ncbi:hypothetical protein BSKO_00603 [Bryopsis sp. KO-2023]|nr:hypothetical protein BSKO_00603 [Bryopsis sp. KO-2023]